MNGNETNKLVKGALLLTLAGLISKILSAGYRIPLQNLTGDIGFYVYQQVYPILGIVMILSLYGFPSAISKMTVELKALGKSLSFISFYLPVLLILVAINGAAFLFLSLNAESVAGWVGDPNLVHTYQLTAFVFLLVPFLALLRGVFQGNYYMKPTAFSQIGEQFARVLMIILAALYIAFGNHKLYQIGQAAALASICGGIVAIVILVFFFIKRKPVSSDKYEIPWNYYVKTLLIFGIVAALNHMVLIVIQFADAFTLIQSLKEFGLTQMEAMEAKGVFDRGQPLIQLGTVLGSSFALALIPSISKEKLELDPTTFYNYIRTALHFSFYLAVGATLGLIAIFPETNLLLFQDKKGTLELQILILAIFLCSVAITASSVLQGMGHIKRTAGFILIAFFVKWTGNQLLVPILGIMGSAIATVFSLLVLYIIVMIELKRKLPGLKAINRINWLALFKASITMIAYILLVDWIVPDAVEATRGLLLFYVLFIALTGGIIFIVTLLKGKAFTEDQLAMLPKAQMFIWIYRGGK